MDDQLYPWSKPPRTLEASFDKIHLWWSTRYKVLMMYLFLHSFKESQVCFKTCTKKSLLILHFCWHILTHYYTYFTHTYISIGKIFYGRNRYLACIETEKFGWEIDQVQRSGVPLYWLLVSLASHNRFKSFLNSAKLPDSNTGTVNKADALSTDSAGKLANVNISIEKRTKKNAPSEMI